MSRFTKFHPIALLLIPFVLIIIWFHTGLVVGGGEEGLPFYNSTKSLELSKQMWWDYNGGFPTLAWLSKITSFYPLTFLQEILHFPNYFLQAGIFFLLMFVGGISVYFLILNFIQNYSLNKRIALVTAIFYILNPYSFSQIWGRGLEAQFFSFSLLPLAILLFLKGLNGKFICLFYLTFSSIIFSAAFGISTFLITYWVVLTISLVYWTIANRRNPKKILYGSTFYFLSLVLFFLVHSWWLLPTITSASQIYSGKAEGFDENLGTLIGVSRNFTPSVLIRLLQRTYFFDRSAFSPIYSTLIFQLISWLMPLFSFIGIFLILRKKGLKSFNFFLILFILGLIISLGANFPFGWLFVWIFKQVPILQSFRNPYEKFGLVYALAYSPIFAAGLVYFFNQIKKLRLFGIVTVLTLVCGIYAWPMWNGKIVSFPNDTPGIDVPKYYQDLSNWLTINNKDNYRIFMTPLWAGDGTFYQWNNTKYQGIDPAIYILNAPAIVSSADFPYFHDFTQNLRKYMERQDMSAPLSLLRAKYLVVRDDATGLTTHEKQQDKYLTEFIYPPSENLSSLTICKDQFADSKNGVAWLMCRLSDLEADWSGIRYLHVTIRTDHAATIEVAITDFNGIRIRWDGRVDSEYTTDNSEWKTFIIPLSSPTEYNNAIDFSSIYSVEVLAHPVASPKKSVDKIYLKDIKLDAGRKDSINAYHLINKFEKLRVFQPESFSSPPDFGEIPSLEKVRDFKELFDKASQKKNMLYKHGFILLSQNQNKRLEDLSGSTNASMLDQSKLSQTKYWLKIDGKKNTYIVLSHNFHPQWKVLKNVRKEQLNGGFFNNIALLKRTSVSEENHFVINGYANLWKVDEGSGEYAIVFMPQLIADTSLKISIFSIMLMGGSTILWQIKKYISSH